MSKHDYRPKMGKPCRYRIDAGPRPLNEVFDGSHDGGAICEGAQIQDQDSDGYPARHYQVDETFGTAELYRPKRGSGGINRF